MSQIKKSSYRKMFSQINECEDFFEIEIIKRIKDDYDKFHKHDFLMFEKFETSKFLICPSCKSENFIHYGKDKNGSQRYKCNECGKLFNQLTSSLFFASKINYKAWFAFLESLLSGASAKEASIVAKISSVTASKWMNKIFLTLKNYQDDIKLSSNIYIDETYVNEDKSKIYVYEELGKTKEKPKKPRGISRNKICILVATDTEKSFGHIVCHGRPQRIKNYEIIRKHIFPNSHLIGDEDTSIQYSCDCLKLTRTQIKSNTLEAYEKLEPIDSLCKRLKYFISKHRGFKKDKLQDYLNLFIYIDNETYLEKDLYKVTVKLMKMMFDAKKQ